ncbi:MAG: ATP-binding protein [Candidatus Omnitrophica bacterium]|nr:ATP-binding protein [Candidatus Omnitrophota bacterium]
MFIEPVFGKKFFGREEVLGTLHKRVTALKGGYRQNLALAGPMLVGKSSILRHFLSNVKDAEVIPLYIEMGEGDFRLFSVRFMATLLYNYLKSVSKKSEGDFEDLKKTCYGLIPKTMRQVDEVCKLVSGKKENAAYEKLLNITSVFKEETGKSCLVVLDEFHNLANLNLKKPFQIFGKYIMIQKNTMYIVSSSQKNLLRDILSQKLSLLFGNFEVIEVDGFDSQTAKSFVSSKMRDERIEESVKDYLIQITQGNPFYLEAFANRFSEAVKHSGNKYHAKECLLSAFSDLLYESNGILNQYFTNNIHFFLEKRSRKRFIPILLAIANGKNTVKAIQRELGKADPELSVELKSLQEMDLIYPSGIFYKISERLFEYWLKYVYSLKTKSMIDDLDIKFLEFKQLIGDDFDEFSRFSGENVNEIIAGLFKKFNNEKVRIGMKCRIMPKFDKVEVKHVTGNIHAITGKLGGKSWLCYVKQNGIADDRDINDLWTAKRVHDSSSIARKIFIPLKGIEQNAFLLAKEQNIWVWDTQTLNGILRLFSKFELVL